SRMFFASSTIRMLAIRASALRKLEREATSPADLSLEDDASAVSLDDVPHDGETQTGGAHVPSVRHLREALEDAVLLVGGDPGPRVPHGDDHAGLGGPGTQLDPPARRGVAQGVRQEVGESPGELRLVHREDEAVGGHAGLQRDPLLPGLDLEDADDALD